MEEKKITVKEFDDAVEKASKELLTDENLTGMSSLLVPLIGMAFALRMKDVLFGKEN